MRRETFNEGGSTDVAFVLGWGNRIEHENVRWLVDRLAAAGHRVTVFQLPTVIADYEAEWVAPIAVAVRELDGYRLLGHSTGGLVGEFLDGAETRVYLSPWWGFHDDLRNPIVTLAMKLPIARPILPAPVEREQLGALATDEQLADSPPRVAPTFLREAARAQADLPPFDEEALVFYAPDDPVVSADAIRERTPAANRVAYEGGHQLFDSPSREEHVETVLRGLERGRAALA